jgi:glycosyltransferase involved in cell wall biosynthesis
MVYITITNYNQYQYIEQLFDSLYSQVKNNKRIQLIWIDDASTDNSVAIIKKHPIYKLDNFKAIIHQQNTWVSEARNEGIKRLHYGDWIVFIDGDDKVKSNYIETLLSYCNDKNNDIYHFDYENITDLDFNPADIEKGVDVMCWSRLIKADIILDNNIKFRDKFKEQGYGEDGAFYEELLKAGATEQHTGDIIYEYRWGVENSLSNICVKQ